MAIAGRRAGYRDHMESPIEVLTRTAYGMLSSGAITAGGPAPTHRQRRLRPIIRLAGIRLPRIRLLRRRAR
jgi:hypothetical protein